MVKGEFIFANLKIVDSRGTQFEFKDIEITKNGCEDLNIDDFESFLNYGSTCKITIHLDKFHKTIDTPGVVIRQFCKEGVLVGLRFFESDKSELEKIINKYGSMPKQQRRASPRIPKVGELKYMPTFAVCKTVPRDVIFLVGNLSMGGCMIYTEDPHSMLIKFDEIYTFELQPRIDFEPILFQAQVTRCEHDYDPKHRIGVYRIGMKFHAFDDKNSDLFKKRVKKVVEEVKALQAM